MLLVLRMEKCLLALFTLCFWRRPELRCLLLLGMSVFIALSASVLIATFEQIDASCVENGKMPLSRSTLCFVDVPSSALPRVVEKVLYCTLCFYRSRSITVGIAKEEACVFISSSPVCWPNISACLPLCDAHAAEWTAE